MATVAPAPGTRPTPAPAPAPGHPARPEAVALREVPYETYCRLRDVEANAHVRMSYLDGELTLMAPALRHDRPAEVLSLIVRVVSAAAGLEVLGIRSTTLRRDRANQRGEGKEADAAFYLGADEARMRGRWELDLAVDPPPSLAIEVDHTGDSAASLAIYARLGVPEVWRYLVGPHSLLVHRLDGETYRQVARSAVLPKLTPTLIAAALDRAGAGDLGENAWFEWLREWARDLPGA